MSGRAPSRTGSGVEVILRLLPVRENSTIHVRGSLEIGGDPVTFDGWLDLLDALERVAEVSLDHGTATGPDDGEGDGRG
ncbi:MAG TPA: hypothetical protein VM262_04915 [Acidimicrobiales bacterium]|nr:hypothetical protein [Acidimicrobiales bacterium]